VIQAAKMQFWRQVALFGAVKAVQLPQNMCPGVVDIVVVLLKLPQPVRSEAVLVVQFLQGLVVDYHQHVVNEARGKSSTEPESGCPSSESSIQA
jgi:hypothetical protein